jgi:DNA invertase Pin-like site-specific DNA recombinase
MSLIGYARVSSTDQDFSIQEAALRAAGCTLVRAEKVSGTSTENRDELKVVLEFLRPGDTLVVTRIDRLARSIRDLQNIVHDLKQRGIHVKATEQAFDTASPHGKLMMDMLAAFAEFETRLRRDRQMEGIAKAKAEGVYKGRPATVNFNQIRELHRQGLGPSAIARELGIGRTSVYRALERAE